MSVMMQARSSTTGALVTWLMASPDWAGTSFPGPGVAQDVAVVAAQDATAGATSPGGANHAVQVNTGGGFDGVSPGASGNVLTSDGTVWNSTAPAAPAVPTGTGLRKVVSGVEAGAAALLVDADVSASAAIALSKLKAPTGTGFATVTAGVWDAASLAQPLPLSKGGTGLTALPGSSAQLLFNSAGAIGAAANVSYDGTNLGLTAGSLVMSNNVPINAKTTGGTNKQLCVLDTGNVFRWSDTGCANVQNFSSTWGVYNGGAYHILISESSNIGMGYPMKGIGTPVRWVSAAVSMTAATTLTSAQYENRFIDVSSTGAFDLIFPTSTDAEWVVYNASASTINLRKTAGTGGIALATLKTQTVRYSATRGDIVAVTPAV